MRNRQHLLVEDITLNGYKLPCKRILEVPVTYLLSLLFIGYDLKVYSKLIIIIMKYFLIFRDP